MGYALLFAGMLFISGGALEWSLFLVMLGAAMIIMAFLIEQ